MKKVIGIEQVGDKQIEHYSHDRRTIITTAVFISFTIAALVVALLTEVSR